MQPEKKKLTLLDTQIAVAILICCLSAEALKYCGVTFQFQGANLDILQKMTACIACLLCCQDTTAVSLKAGTNRLIITVIGGLTGIAYTFVDTWINNVWIMCFVIAIGILVTFYFCKLTGVPYINTRIGGVTFILVSSTLGGNARIWYAIFRLVSTIYGAIVVLIVTWVFSKLFHKE